MIKDHKCYQCGELDDQPAGEKCRNPRWHLPNLHAEVKQPKPRLPYAEDHED